MGHEPLPPIVRQTKVQSVFWGIQRVAVGHDKIKQRAMVEESHEDVTGFRKRHFHVREHAAPFQHGSAIGRVKRVERGVGSRVDFAVFVAVAVIQALNASSAGRVVFGDRHLHPGAIGQFDGFLNEPFAKRFLTNHHCPVQILQGAGDNFAGRRGPPIDQHHHGHVWNQSIAPCLVRLVPFVRFAFRADHFLVFAHENVDHGDGFPEQPAAISTEVHHKRLGLERVFQEHHRFSDFGARGFGERPQREVAHAIGEHSPVGDVWDFHLAAFEFKIQRPVVAGPPNFEGHHRARRPFHQFPNAVLGQRLESLAVHPQQLVAQTEPGLLGRFVVEQIHDDKGSVLGAFDARADAAIFPRLHEPHVFHFGFGEVAGVGIQLGKHGVDAGFHHLAWRQVIHVAQVQFPEGRLHDLELLGHLEEVVLDSGSNEEQGCDWHEPERPAPAFRLGHGWWFFVVGTWPARPVKGCFYASSESTSRWMARRR